MQIQRVQNNNTTFGTRCSQNFIAHAKKAAEKGLFKPNATKNVKTLLVDGLEDVVIDTKTVSNYDGYLQSHDVLCIRNPKLEDLLHSAKDTKVLYYDEEYYNAAQELKKRGLLGGVDCTLDKQIAYSSLGHNIEISDDPTSSMIYAIFRQTGENVNIMVDECSAELEPHCSTNRHLWNALNDSTFAQKFTETYKTVVKNLETLTRRQEELSGKPKYIKELDALADKSVAVA